MLRTVCVLVLSLTIVAGIWLWRASAAEGATRHLLNISTLSSPTKVVSAGTRKALATRITRQAQVQALQRGPQAVRDALTTALQGATTLPRSDLVVAQAFRQGLVLTPLSATYPSGAAVAALRAGLVSDRILLGLDVPLPNSSQQPPLAYSSVPDADTPIAVLLVQRVPESGAHVVTLSATRLGSWEHAPTVLVSRGDEDLSPVEAVGNTDVANSTQWTVLLQLTAGQNMVAGFMYDPGMSISTQVAWSAVTIRKL